MSPRHIIILFKYKRIRSYALTSFSSSSSLVCFHVNDCANDDDGKTADKDAAEAFDAMETML